MRNFKGRSWEDEKLGSWEAGKLKAEGSKLKEGARDIEKMGRAEGRMRNAELRGKEFEGRVARDD